MRGQTITDLQQAIEDATDAGMSVSVHPTDGYQVQVCVSDGYEVVSEEVAPDRMADSVEGGRILFIAQRVFEAVPGVVRRWFGGAGD